MGTVADFDWRTHAPVGRVVPDYLLQPKTERHESCVTVTSVVASQSCPAALGCHQPLAVAARQAKPGPLRV